MGVEGEAEVDVDMMKELRYNVNMVWIWYNGIIPRGDGIVLGRYRSHSPDVARHRSRLEGISVVRALYFSASMFY